MSLLFPRRNDLITQFLCDSLMKPSLDHKTYVAPSCDYHYTDNHAVISAELPGYDKDNISIVVEGSCLTIKAEKDSVTEKSDGNHVCSERYHGTCKRTIKLPFSASDELVTAKYENGILNITVEKPESAQPKKISIQ